jgi:DNA-binding MarR family transcriptional regulator
VNAHARRTDPETAHEAAESISDALPALEAQVLTALRARGDRGATTHELAEYLQLSLVTVSPRLRPLALKGLVLDSGFKRAGSSGRRSIVWKVRTVPRQGILSL